jgi:DNA-binding MarR family transcriptional regulator
MPDSATNDEVMSALRLAVLAVERSRRATAAELNIGISEMAALGHLHHDGALTPSDLGNRLNLSSGTMTALVDRLEETGLARRTPNPEDRRSHLIEITDDGSTKTRAVFKRFNSAGAGTLKRTTAEQRAWLVEILESLATEITAVADAIYEAVNASDE